MRFFIVLTALLLAFSCKEKVKKPVVTFTGLKSKKEKKLKTTRPTPFPKAFVYKPYGLRDPFESPEAGGNFTFGKVLAVLRGEGNEFLILMDVPGRGMAVVKKGDVIGDVKIVGIKKGYLVVRRRRIMPWGEVKVYREKIPLPGVGE